MDTLNTHLYTNLSLSLCINAIRNLPDMAVAQKHGIYIDFGLKGDVGEVFDAIRSEYRHKADWLEYLLVGQTPPSSHFYFGEKSHFKIFAEYSKAIRELAIQTMLLSKNLQDYAINPNLLWLLIEFAECLEGIKNSGLTGAAKTVGKKEQYSNAVEFCNLVIDPAKLKFKNMADLISEPLIILMTEATLLAKDSQNIQFRRHYETFLRAEKKFYRDVQNDPCLQLIALTDDGVHKTGNGKRGLGKKKLKYKV